MNSQPVARIANRYRVLRKLGQGGMGVVYHAHDDLTDRPVALKQVLVAANQLQFKTTLGSSNIYVALATEFRTLANLRHPYVVQVLDYGYDDAGNPFFTMEYVPDAQPITEAGQSADMAFQLQALGQMLTALVYLHRRGIIHRDLKPGNVLVDANRKVSVLDFGLALESRPSQSDISAKDGNLVGTLAYIAPEILQDERYSVASDLFAVGIIAYEIFTGRHPFDLTNISKLMMDILMTPADVSDIDEQLVDWMEDLLDKDPDQRPHSAQTALEQLYAAVQQEKPAQDTAVRESFLRASAFVGRNAELTQLTDALMSITSPTSTERYTAFLLGGESGVGKSRLLEEVRTRALIQGFRVLRGQAVETSSIPYQVSRDIARPLLLSTDVTDLEAGILKEVIPDVERLIGRDVPDVPALNGKANLERRNLVIVDLLKRQKKPLLLIFEDIQWDTQLLEIAASLLPLFNQFQHPVMVLASYSSDEAPHIPELLPSMQLITLKRLDREAVRKLAVSMLGDAGNNDELLNVLERETEGNIFFIVEVMRALAETAGSLEQVAEVGLPEKIVAGGMIEILRKRLDSVPTDFQEMLHLAAVMGRQLDGSLLKAALPTQDTEAFITVGANRAIFDFVDDIWRFAHDKLRDTLLEDFSPEKTTTLHRRAAEAIEATYPDDIAYAQALLIHWDAAGNATKTVHYTDVACEQLIQFTGEYGKAEQYLKRGLSLAETLKNAERVQSRLHKHYGDLYQRRGELTQAEAAYKQAIDAASQHKDLLVRPLLGLANVYRLTGNFDEAKRLNERALALIDEGHEPLAKPDAYLTKADIAGEQGNYAEHLTNVQQALAIVRAANKVDRQAEARVLSRLGVSYYQRTDFNAAKDSFEQALLIRNELGDRYQAAYILRNLGFLAQMDGELEKAEAQFREALTIAQEIGSDSQADFQVNLGILEVERSNYAEAIAYYENAITLLRQMGRILGLIETIVYQTHTLLHVGDITSGETNLRECFALLDDLDSKPLLLATLIQVAHWHAQQGQFDQAVRYLILVEGQPETPKEHIDTYLIPLKEQWEKQLPADDFARWTNEAKSQDLESMIAAAKEIFKVVAEDTDMANE